MSSVALVYLRLAFASTADKATFERPTSIEVWAIDAIHANSKSYCMLHLVGAVLRAAQHVAVSRPTDHGETMNFRITASNAACVNSSASRHMLESAKTP